MNANDGIECGIAAPSPETGVRKWIARLRWKLFPYTYCPQPEAPVYFKNVIVHNVRVDVSFTDRLRVLFSGRLIVESRIATQEHSGSMISASQFSALPPRWMQVK